MGAPPDHRPGVWVQRAVPTPREAEVAVFVMESPARTELGRGCHYRQNWIGPPGCFRNTLEELPSTGQLPLANPWLNGCLTHAPRTAMVQSVWRSNLDAIATKRTSTL